MASFVADATDNWTGITHDREQEGNTEMGTSSRKEVSVMMILCSL